MIDLREKLEARLPAEGRHWLDEALRARAHALDELLPQLPRRIGRGALAPERVTAGDAQVDLAAWRLCDAAAHVLFTKRQPGDAQLVDLFTHGDVDERQMVLRALTLLPITDATIRLLGEAQRTNTQPLFEAATCDSNLLARAARDARFGEQAFARTLLKLAFLNLPLARCLQAEQHASQDLSRMLQDLATEREAAGRSVWADTNRMIARAPTEGSLARLVGGLEHGDDAQRAAAAEGLLLLNRHDLLPFLRERLEREPKPAIRTVLARALELGDTR